MSVCLFSICEWQGSISLLSVWLKARPSKYLENSVPQIYICLGAMEHVGVADEVQTH